MNLNLCAACAAPLSDHEIQSCVRCQTPYCSRVECIWQGCYRQHNIVPCEDIAAAGGAERYHADKKYKEAVAVAVAACAAETTEETCYICYMGNEDDDEGLVRGCACRGTSGYAHVSCLAEQAKIMVAHNFEPNVKGSTWDRWRACRICGQHYHGVVKRALGWACWKTYVGRTEDYAAYLVWAMSRLGKDINTIGSPETRLELFEAQMAVGEGLNEQEILSNLSNAAASGPQVHTTTSADMKNAWKLNEIYFPGPLLCLAYITQILFRGALTWRPR